MIKLSSQSQMLCVMSYLNYCNSKCKKSSNPLHNNKYSLFFTNISQSLHIWLIIIIITYYFLDCTIGAAIFERSAINRNIFETFMHHSFIACIDVQSLLQLLVHESLKNRYPYVSILGRVDEINRLEP